MITGADQSFLLYAAGAFAAALVPWAVKKPRPQFSPFYLLAPAAFSVWQLLSGDIQIGDISADSPIRSALQIVAAGAGASFGSNWVIKRISDFFTRDETPEAKDQALEALREVEEKIEDIKVEQPETRIEDEEHG